MNVYRFADKLRSNNKIGKVYSKTIANYKKEKISSLVGLPNSERAFVGVETGISAAASPTKRIEQSPQRLQSMSSGENLKYVRPPKKYIFLLFKSIRFGKII